MPNRPVLAVVSGPPATGKSTLARILGQALGCPTIIRDEIKQGMVMSTPGHQAEADDPLNIPTMDAFFETITVLLRAGVTLVAEAAYQDRLWRPGLEPLSEIADIRVIRCVTPASTIVGRITQRARTDTHRAAHADAALLTDMEAGTYAPDEFVPISLDVPTLVVDTADGYSPGPAVIEGFLLGDSRGGPVLDHG
ncbi:AAA family ATPase [Streptomyces virginiae]|uniref:AAA family ATPase n=1 Tax=Streptomyces virginiae TaxID=1961 RepID=UPI00367BD82C